MARTFANTAARIAYSVDPVYEAARRLQWIQLDTGMVYEAVKGGTGAECWAEVFKRDGSNGGVTFETLIGLNELRECDGNGDVANIAGIGGLLASDTTPILRGNAAETQEVVWATGNADPLVVTIPLPANFDGSANVTVTLAVSSGATDAATFTVETGWDGGALVSDSASDAATKSATQHNITAIVAAADVPNTATVLTLILTPAAHATDTISLYGVKVSGTLSQTA